MLKEDHLEFQTSLDYITRPFHKDGREGGKKKGRKKREREEREGKRRREGRQACIVTD